MNLLPSTASSWLALWRASVLFPAAFVLSCSGKDGTVPTMGSKPGTTVPHITPTESSAPPIGGSIIDLCGESGCPSPTTGDASCDGGAAVTILGLDNPSNVIGAAQRRRLLGESASSDGCNKVIDWGGSDAGVVAQVPPKTEDYACPSGSTRIHIRDIWSKLADPTLGTMPSRPMTVMLVDNAWGRWGARQETANCDWYSLCAPSTLKQFKLTATATSCGKDLGNLSGNFDINSFASASDVWIDYTGASTSLPADYAGTGGNAKVAAGAFRVTSNRSDVASELCAEGSPPSGAIPGYARVHVRYPWGDPAKTGFQGSACEEAKLGTSSPPYPTMLKVSWTGVGAASSDDASCDWGVAMLDLQNSHCPWYTMYVPDSAWSGTNVSFKISYPNAGAPVLETGPLSLPAPKTQDEYWLAYTGPTDNVAWSDQGTVCMNWSTRPDSMHYYTQNPGPGYAGCGGDGNVVSDPCNPPSPPGYHNVHFRYLWAGQKTFTFFPALDLMPKWLIMEITPQKATPELPAVNITCTREADRPWFVCQIPDGYFAEGTTWRAVDKTNIGKTEWNTVNPRPFPTEAKEWWIRWYYGKPDFGGEFKAFDYYPDGVGGDWSATGVWNDQDCTEKPAPTEVKIGYGGWFPYDETGYVYPNGASLSVTYVAPKVIQPLFNYLVQERYEIWKERYLRYDADACGVGTARVHTDPPIGPTVSEGQGYGIAISAAIGDKETFEKLWRFTRHFLSKSAKQYCGGLMGWIWKGPESCRPLDVPCDPDTEQCPGDGDSAFDGDVDIGIGLVYAALQWPEYRTAAVSWLLKMECELNSVYQSPWIFPAAGDTWNKNCQFYEKGNPNSKPCTYIPGGDGTVFVDYYPPGYFRVFGDFLYKFLDTRHYSEAEKTSHRNVWYKAAESVYELYERCYDQANINPGLVNDRGFLSTPCSGFDSNYDWARYMWRVGIDAAWFGNRTDLPENQPGSSQHYATKSRMRAKIDNIQEFFNNFYKNNPVEPNANRFSSICDRLKPDGTITDCDPAYGHNSYFVGTMASAYVSVFDNDGKTTGGIRREAIEEAISTAIENDLYFQESLGVYTLLFLTGNFPNPLTVK